MRPVLVQEGSSIGVRVLIVTKTPVKAGESEGGQEGEGAMNQTEQLNLPGVPRAKQGREVSPQWEWTEAKVWTERMLATLERGVKVGKYNAYFAELGLISLKALATAKRASPAT